MAKKGKKKNRVNVDPTLSVIRSIFQENLQIVNRLQRDSKSDYVTKFDMTDKLYNRRSKAVAHLMPEMMARYANKYPEIDIQHEFADVSSRPILTYDMIDKEMDLCLGAAIWMLDQIWEEHQMEKLCDLLPTDYNYVAMPDVYDTRFSHEIIDRMVYVIQNRYGNDDRCVVPMSILSKRENSAFHAILDLIPNDAKRLAVEKLKLKFWEWADLYFNALSPLSKEVRRLDKVLDRLTAQLHEIEKGSSQGRTVKPMLPIATPMSMLDNNLMNGPTLEKDMLIRQGKNAEEAHNKIRQKIGKFRCESLQAATANKDCLKECMDEQCAEELYNFPIDDPYEMCFAIFYLLDQDDDYAWIYSFMAAVIYRAASMLPWGFDIYDEEDDGFWFDEGAIIDSLPTNPEWYKTIYAGQRYDEEIPHEASIAQIVYENTGALLPRNMHRYDSAIKSLKRRGLKPSQASMVCAVMNVLGEASRQFEYRVSEGKYEVTPEYEEITPQLEKKDSASEEIERLKKELAQLKARAKEANYALSHENRELKEKLEKQENAVQEMAQELADLREIVFNQQSGAEEKEIETESKIAFPYHTAQRIVAFGGHDSWLREIKFKLPDVRFMSDDITSPEIIRRADVVWIQTNCIGHKYYYSIIDIARRYNRKVRYFKYASATKCAEQIVEEEEKM